VRITGRDSGKFRKTQRAQGEKSKKKRTKTEVLILQKTAKNRDVGGGHKLWCEENEPKKKNITNNHEKGEAHTLSAISREKGH